MHRIPQAQHEFREQLEVVFMALKNRDSPYGSQTWFAKVCGRSPRQIRAWLAPKRKRVPKIAAVLLAHIVETVPDGQLETARRRRRRWYEVDKGQRSINTEGAA